MIAAFFLPAMSKLLASNADNGLADAPQNSPDPSIGIINEINAAPHQAVTNCVPA